MKPYGGDNIQTEKLSPEETLRRFRIARSMRKTYSDKEDELKEALKKAGIWVLDDSDGMTQHRYGDEVLELTEATYSSFSKTDLLKALVAAFGQQELVNAGIVEVDDDLQLVFADEFYSYNTKPRLNDVYREDSEPIEVDVDEELVELAEREDSAQRVPKHEE